MLMPGGNAKGKGLEVDGKALLFPIAIADGFWPVAATQFGGTVGGLGLTATFLGLGQGALGGGGKGLVHDNSLCGFVA
jgi:hypothetical protein